jgi:hypothetical protein
VFSCAASEIVESSYDDGYKATLVTAVLSQRRR